MKNIKAMITYVLFFYLLFISLVFGANAKWTFMVYLDADNDLESAGIKDFLEMAQAGSDENINIVVQMDRVDGYSSDYDDWSTCKRFLVLKNMVPDKNNQISDIGEVNMGNPSTLNDFINWSTNNYPAEKYALIFWNHGDGWRKKNIQNNSNIRKTKKFNNSNSYNKGVCYDESSSDDVLYMSEVKSVLINNENKIDIVGFDACLMGMMEVAYQIKNTGAKVMIASEELEPGDGWPYDTILSELKNIYSTSNSSANEAKIGSIVVEKYFSFYNNNETQSAVDLTKIDDLAGIVSNFASTIISSWKTDKQSIKNIANTVMNQIKNLVINEKHGDIYRGSKGLAIYFPDNISSFDNEYNNLNVDFVKNTAWDEFLNEYYTSMQGSWIENARRFSSEFQKEYGGGHIDLYHFCSLLSNPPETDPVYIVTYNTENYKFEDISKNGSVIRLEDEEYKNIPIGFQFVFYGKTYDNVSISDNGVLYFQDVSYGNTAYSNELIPGSDKWGQIFIAPYWTDLNPSSSGEIYWMIQGNAPERKLIVTWNNIPVYEYEGNNGTFQAILYEDQGKIQFNYEDLDFGYNQINFGGDATIGVQNSNIQGLQYSYNTSKITNKSSLIFSPPETCTYKLSSSSQIFDSNGGVGSIAVQSNTGCQFEVKNNEEWIIITSNSTGFENDTVNYKINKNTDYNSRKGYINIENQIFEIIQYGICSYNIYPLSIKHTASGGYGSITVITSQDSCQWQAQSNASWIEIISGQSNEGSGIVNYIVSKNNNSVQRNGLITIGQKTITIIQEPDETPEPILIQNNSIIKNLSSELLNSRYYKIEIIENVQNFIIKTWGGDGDCNLYLRYGEIPTDTEFDEISNSNDNNETINIINPQPGIFYIRIFAYKAYNGLSFEVNYSLEKCLFTLSPEEQYFNHLSNNSSITIKPNLSNCFWSASTDVSWIKITSNTSGRGDGILFYNILANTSNIQRIGNIIINDHIFKVYQEKQEIDEIIEINSGVPVSNISSQIDNNLYYKIEVPDEGYKNLSILIWSEQGDCDLYVKYGSLPDLDDYDYCPYLEGSNEEIFIDDPKPGTWYIMLNAYQSFSDLSLQATYNENPCEYTLNATNTSFDASGGAGVVSVISSAPGCPWTASASDSWISINSEYFLIGNGAVEFIVNENPNPQQRFGELLIAGQLIQIDQLAKDIGEIESLNNNEIISNLSASSNSIRYYKVEISEDISYLSFDIWGGQGDCDLYIMFNELPDLDYYDYAESLYGNTENVSIENPDKGTWYIMLYAYDSYSDLSLKIFYNNSLCTYTVTPSSNTFNYNSDSSSFYVETTDSNCNWNVSSDSDWINIDSNIINSGNQTINFSVSQNNTNNFRLGTISIADQLFLVTQYYKNYTGPVIIENFSENDNISGEKNSTLYYQINVEENFNFLSISIYGGIGDCDLYIKYDTLPTIEDYDYAPLVGGNSETVTLNDPLPGKWFIMLYGYDPYSNLTLKAFYKNLEISHLNNDIAIENINLLKDQEKLYFISIPQNTDKLTVSSWGGSGNINLYLMQGILPKIDYFDYSSINEDNNEFINIEYPWDGNWYILVSSETDSKNVSIKASYEPITIYKTGDFNGDSIIDLKDAIAVLKLLCEFNPTLIKQDYFSSKTDLLNNGKIGIQDIIMILNIISQ